MDSQPSNVSAHLVPNPSASNPAFDIGTFAGEVALAFVEKGAESILLGSQLHL